MYLKLRSIRKINNYTEQNMADLLGISKPYYSQIENNKRNLSYELAIRISKIFNLKPDDIFYEDHMGIS